MVSQWVQSITHSFRIQRICVICHEEHSRTSALCDTCLQSLKRITSPCSACGCSLPDDSTGLCGACCQTKPCFDRVFSVYLFEEPLRTLMHQFKYHGELYLASSLTEFMLEALPAHYSSACLIPVPLHRKKLRKRGFNQSLLLAKRIGRAVNIPVALLCDKVLDTPAQARLNQAQREQNLEKAFQVQPIPYEHVTLIDDVLTTGSTANVIARELKANGAKRVDVLCCARR